MRQQICGYLYPGAFIIFGNRWCPERHHMGACKQLHRTNMDGGGAAEYGAPEVTCGAKNILRSPEILLRSLAILLRSLAILLRSLGSQ